MPIMFNSQILPGIIIALQRPVVARTRAAEVVRGGSYSQGGQIAAKRIIVRGLVKGIVSLAQQAAALDNLNARLPIGVLAPLKIDGETNRSYRAEVESITDTFDPRRFCLEYEVSFLVPSGSSESDTEFSGSWIPDQSPTFVVTGNERVRPRWVVSLGYVSAGASVTIANSTTGEVITFSPADAAARTLDADMETIVAGSTDRTAEWVSGSFPTLVAGSNSISFAASNCQVTNVSVFYKPRYR